jgi:hypothetical protein
MTDRKFTPPTEFPARYVTSDGHEAVILGKRPGDVSPYVGHIYESRSFPVVTWRSDGSYLNTGENRLDLHDLPKKQVHWCNDYGSYTSDWGDSREEIDITVYSNRIAVIRREWVEGQQPQYFAEEV